MQQLSAWVGAGFVTAGVTAAFFAGSGVATADTGSESGPSSSSSDSSSPSSSPSSTDKKDKPDKPGPANKADKPDKPAKADKPDKADKPEKPSSGSDSTDKDDEDATDKDAENSAPEEPTVEAPATDDTADPDVKPATKPATKPAGPKKAAGIEQQAAIVAAPETTPDPEPAAAVVVDEEPTPEVEPAVAAIAKVTKTQAAQPLSATSLSATRMAQAAVSTTIAPPAPMSVLDAIGSGIRAVVGSIVVTVGSFAINTLQTIEALVTGPPVLPPNSTVTVRSSTITLSTGQRVAANWYYPEGDVPPDRMILLSHGFLALGPMYSYTAANLAEQTHSIVVTPTLPSNFFAADDHWLGGIGMAEVMADLFVGEREALTQSAINAGFATRYGLDPATAALPQKFGLAGHSLGGQLVSGMAGFLAENGAADDLVGVITLDGVPTGTTLADSIDKLDAYEAAGGHYIPIREIGAPWNLFNSISNVNQSLNEGRPGRYNGVVLSGGVHMDSMLGGNPLIQFTAYVVAGIPRPINPPAVGQLAATWFNQWFEGQTDIGDDLVPGSTIDIVTPRGTAKGVVIGAPPAAGSTSVQTPLTFAASAPTDIPRLDPYLAALSA
jgi:hypothetical protein